jgi:hypothetical protein
VAARFQLSIRIDNLSFMHHRVVASLPDEAAFRLLVELPRLLAAARGSAPVGERCIRESDFEALLPALSFARAHWPQALIVTRGRHPFRGGRRR